MGPHLQQIKSELDQFRPDLVMCASKGGAYVVGLWEAGLWLGPTLMINAHPTCVRLPRGVPVVLAAGGDDEHYPSTRKALHRLVATGTASHSFLYYAAGSGPRLPPGFAPRPGDRHNMYSLLQNDCLPRLMDAALCPEGAEVHLWPPGPTRTHAALGSESRLRAERPLREALLQRLDAAQRRGAAAWPAPSVEPGSQEFGLVAAAFAAPPRAASAYRFRAAVPFEATRIAAVHRVEPRPDAAAAALRRLAELRGSLEQRGVPFEADVHARWAFYHGCGASALGAGLQHLDGPWGAGIYFAREARHVVDSGVCTGPDGSRAVFVRPPPPPPSPLHPPPSPSDPGRCSCACWPRACPASARRPAEASCRSAGARWPTTALSTALRARSSTWCPAPTRPWRRT
ncbi:unnamed protein product [Prorocentrum cordatum]|uniref:PARP n=1 Tax=Prorocentrum cordatum TaxID=2364126 RepID=A0ABN9WIS5_9DINO|nr:unnamed protein product [Polarella glacialis]